ncbi:NERD domain-containing protein [Marinoscillum sp.]|uniref:nuclease-related domain-containing DEAD/DEAH box helicase n=1 Tax=Marinoscillum sp. TaxID=2024838 RepID=UPI003BAC605B
MSVHFFPQKPIELLERFIQKEDGRPLQGEIEVYRKLFLDLSKSKHHWLIWHDLHLPFHSDSLNPGKKASAQIDFLILSTQGVIILEVKGGKISFHNNTFFYDHNGEESKIPQDPYIQAEGYKYTIKDHVLNVSHKSLICHAVCFPHSSIAFDTSVLDPNILWTRSTATKYDQSIEKFILSVFEYNREKHKEYGRIFPLLKDHEIQNIRSILSPLVKDVNQFFNADTHEWLNVTNLEILDSLKKNDRIMIEGGPGTGKTTLAKAFIDEQLTKKGLYLCWNNLLMHYTKYVLRERGLLGNCEVNTYSRFLAQHIPSISHQLLLNASESGFSKYVRNGFDQLKSSNGTIPHYDYLVVDEGQDVFDRGIDILINELVGPSGDGLTNGRCLLLYDIDQSYYLERREVTEISDLLSEYFAHFKLNEVKRSAQNPDIKQLADSLISVDDPLSLLTNWVDPGVKINHFKSLELIKDHIVKKVLTSVRDKKSSLRGSDCIILVESQLLKDTYGDEPGMHYWLTMRDVEELTESNISDKANILRYTSMLKYKGLEKENVFLVISEPKEENKYEIYVGITRAISHLEILVLTS